ncbi:MAG: exo-alpha-sialidase [Pseudomonadota bacterium]
MAEHVQLLVGTTKGAFLINAADDRSSWAVTGPYCGGCPINHLAADPKTGTIWAGGGGDWDGAVVWRSVDGGSEWDPCQLTRGTKDRWAAEDAEFAEMIGWTDAPLPFEDDFQQIWSLGFHHDKLFAGAKPATLLVSSDGGQSFEKVSSLTDDPAAKDWNPGAAGLTLHTLEFDPADPNKIWVGISAAGVFASEDGGTSWERRNRMSNATGCPDQSADPAAPSGGETGLCVHNMVRANAAGDILYQQNHQGVWRSTNGGRSWDDITHGLPSTFGFPIRVHPQKPEMIWTIPLNGDDAGRFPPDAAAAVWRSTDAGETWEAMREGLPQEACYFTVLRQAMAVDQHEAVGLYFGTNSGSIFASFDEGQSWSEIVRHLPTILSVETA